MTPRQSADLVSVVLAIVLGLVVGVLLRDVWLRVW